MTQRQNISDYNPGAENLPLISGVVGYSGRIPPSHILEVHADLRGEDFDSEDPQFVEYSMPEERDKLLRAIDIAEEYGSYYPGMEDELDQEDDDLNEDDWDDHNQALQDTGFWGRAGAGVLFQARDTGRILFAHRSRHVEQPGTWGTWGGAIDSGENPAQAAARESMEEAGYRPNPNDIIPLYVFEHESGFRYYNFLVITPTEFEPMLDWETQGYEWVEYGNWPSPLHFGAADLLRDSKSTAVMQKLSQ